MTRPLALPAGPTSSGCRSCIRLVQKPSTTAIEPPEIAKSTTQAKRKAGKRPKASRRKTYQPPSCGKVPPSSAKVSAPHIATNPPRAQMSRIGARPGSSAATAAGVKKSPIPMMPPITIIVASKRESLRGSRRASIASARAPCKSQRKSSKPLSSISGVR